MKYVITWEENTFTTKYHNGESSGTAIFENAIKYDTEEEAQSVIDANEWHNCYVTENPEEIIC